MKHTRRVLVTGAGGLIGAHAVKALQVAGFDVAAASRSRYGRRDGVDWHRVDLLKPGAAEALVRDVRATHLLHLAWDTTHGRFWAASSNLDWVAASLSLLRAFATHGGRRAVVAGTCAEYAPQFGHCLEDVTPVAPQTLYGISKHALHLIISAFAKQSGLSTAWGRVFFLYGPEEPEARFVPSITRPLLRGQNAVCSNGHLLRDFLHVEDVGSAFAALLESGVEGTVNIASGRDVPLRDVAIAIAELAGRPDLLQIVPPPTLERQSTRLVADVTRLNRDVGWSPAIDLRQGLSTTVEWWRQQLAKGGP